MNQSSTPSTRRRSLDKSKPHIPPSQAKVLSALRIRGPQSRYELSASTGLRLSSVCARVSELMAKGFVVVSGEKYDCESQRDVEVLGLAA